jgi:predicted transcriptional regulator
VESEKQKLNRAKKLLEERQKKLEKQLHQLPEPEQDRLTPESPGLTKPRSITKSRKKVPEKRSLEFEVPTGRKVTKQMIPRKRRAKEIPEGKKTLVIQARLKGNSIKESAIKQLKKSLLGKQLEAIKSITPVYLPLLKVHVKVLRGSIFAKEYSGVFYWDVVTGEIITDVNDILKRSKGISTLMNLTPNQAKVLTAVDTWGTNDVVDIQQDLDLSVTQVKRTLTELNKKSMVAKELQPEKKIYNYKRMVKLKYPKKFEKVKVDMPRIILSNVVDEVLPARFKLRDLETIIATFAQGTRIINTEEVYYRVVLLDALSGADDRTLTEIIQFQK